MRYTDLSQAGAPSGLWLIEPAVFTDERGSFYESFRSDEFAQHIGKVDFVQDNHATSTKHIARGLHYQRPPYAQGKLVRVTNGSVLDVAVDIRKDSPTFAKYHTIELSADNKKQFWIPEGFAHGYICLSDVCDFVYKTTNFYAPEHEGSLNFNDPQINIKIPENIKKISLSAKDSQAPTLKMAESLGF